MASRSWLRIDWQQAVFADLPKRFELARLRPPWSTDLVRIAVHRNQIFEPIASLMPAFLAYAGWQAEMVLSDYDDSLSIATDQAPAEVHMVWLDFDRYTARLSPSAIASWVSGRIAALRESTSAPILLNDWPGTSEGHADVNAGIAQLAKSIPGLYRFPLSDLAADLGSEYVEPRLEGLTGSSMSGRAHVAIAQELGLRWLPALLGARIKAICIDLDGTLHDGVLAEDGPSGITVTADHERLYEELRTLRSEGILIGLVSRNERDDVVEWLDAHSENGLTANNFDASWVSWEAKSKAVEAAAQSWNIGLDSIVFIDDNPGELAEVAATLPSVQLLYATSAGDTRRALSRFPGMLKLKHTKEDTLRASDIHSASERASIARESESAEAYLAALKVELRLELNPLRHVTRLHELSVKTNQFNTRLLRLSEAQVAQYIQDEDRAAVAISLRDKLTDSGIVGALFADRSGSETVVDEICISCRALGRGVEDVMIAEALEGIMGSFDVAPDEMVTFPMTDGDRNEPARRWLERVTVGGASSTPVSMPWHEARSAAASVRVDISWGDET